LRVPNFNVTTEKGYTKVVAFHKSEDFFKSLETIIGNQSIHPDVQMIANIVGSSRMINNSDDYSIYEFENGGAKIDTLNVLFDINRDNTLGDGFKYKTYLNGFLVQSDLVSDTPAYPFSGTMQIGRDRNFESRAFVGSMAYFAIFKGILSEKQILQLTNNILLKNPPTSWFNTDDLSLELFIDFNNPYQIDSSLYFPDLSPNGHLVEAIGYTDISTLIDNLVDIDSLR
jgi:hypothetical protein